MRNRAAFLAALLLGSCATHHHPSTKELHIEDGIIVCAGDPHVYQGARPCTPLVPDQRASRSEYRTLPVATSTTEPPTTTTSTTITSPTITTTTTMPMTTTTRPSQEVVSNVRVVNSTAYCLSGHTANGESVHEGGVALNFAPLGTWWKVTETGAVYEANDRIGYGSDFDIWMSSCDQANAYGRHTIHVMQVNGEGN